MSSLGQAEDLNIRAWLRNPRDVPVRLRSFAGTHFWKPGMRSSVPGGLQGLTFHDHSAIIGPAMSADNLTVQSNYDRLSRFYDLLAGRAERRAQELGLEKLNAQPGETVLELGSGTGRALVALAQAVGPSGRVYGVDLSQGMLAVAKARLAKAGLENRVTLIRGDARSLPVSDDSCSAVFMSLLLELFPEQEIPIVLAQCRRVLRSGGRISIVAMAQSARLGMMLRLYQWAHRRWPGVIDCRPIRVQEDLARAGFEILDVGRMTMYGLPVEIVLARRPS